MDEQRSKALAHISSLEEKVKQLEIDQAEKDLQIQTLLHSTNVPQKEASNSSLKATGQDVSVKENPSRRPPKKTNQDHQPTKPPPAVIALVPKDPTTQTTKEEKTNVSPNGKSSSPQGTNGGKEKGHAELNSSVSTNGDSIPPTPLENQISTDDDVPSNGTKKPSRGKSDKPTIVVGKPKTTPSERSNKTSPNGEPTRTEDEAKTDKRVSKRTTKPLIPSSILKGTSLDVAPSSASSATGATSSNSSVGKSKFGESKKPDAAEKRSRSTKKVTLPSSSSTTTPSLPTISPFQPLKTPPPGFQQFGLPPLKGAFVVLDSGVSQQTGFGFVLLSVSLSRRNFYSLLDGQGNVLKDFTEEGTEFPKTRVDNLPHGSSITFQIAETKTKTLVPDCTQTVHFPSIPPPLPPTNLIVLDRQRTFVKVKWTNPDSDGGSPLVGFEYEFEEKKQIIEKNEIILKGLLPGTTHTFKVAAINALGTSLKEASIVFRTASAPPNVPTGIEMDSEVGREMKLKIGFPERDNGSEITSIEIQQKELTTTGGGDAPFQVIYNSLCTPTELIPIRHLKENTKYGFRARAQNREGNSPWTSVFEFQTTVGIPLEMDPPLVKTVVNELYVSWKGNGHGLTYCLEAKREGFTSWHVVYSGEKEFFQGISSLLFPGQFYVFRVSASNCRGRGVESKPSLMFKIKAVPPQPPKGVPRIVSCDVDKQSMVIQFDPSENSGGSPQSSSVVEIRRISSGATILPLKNQLSPQVHLFRTETEFLTYQAIQKQQRIAAESTSSSNAADSNVKEVNKFKVGDVVDAIYHHDLKYYRGKIHSIVEENSLYQVCFEGYGNMETIPIDQIRFAFSIGDEVIALLYETTPGAPQGGGSKEESRKVLGEVVQVLKEGYLLLFKGRSLGRQITYASDVFPLLTTKPTPPPTISTTATPPATPPLLPKTSSMDVLSSHILSNNKEWLEVCETPFYECVLLGLEPGATYEVRIAACSDESGRGPFGPNHLLKMDSGVPLEPISPPEFVGVKSNGKISLKFPPPRSDQGSPLLSVSLQYVPVDIKQDNGETLLLSTCSTFPPTLVFTGSTEMETAQFKPDRDLGSLHFALRSRFRNKVGYGNWSEWGLLKNVPPLLPNAPTGLDVSLGTSENNSGSILVKFNKMDHSGGCPVIGYRIYYHLNEYCETTETQVLLKPLLLGNTYEIKVQAVNQVGPGSFTNSEMIRIPGLPPSALCTQVAVHVRSHREFMAEWEFNVADDSNGEIVFFDTEYLLNPISGNTKPPPAILSIRGEMGMSTTKSFVKNSKTTLQPGASYWFRVRASNRMGSGPFSDWVLFTMLPQPKKQVAVSTTPIPAVLVALEVSLLQVLVSQELEISIELQVVTNQGLLPLNSSLHIVEITELHKKTKKVSEFANVLCNEESGRVWVRCGHHLKPTSSYSLRVQMGLHQHYSKSVVFHTPDAPVVVVDPALNTFVTPVHTFTKELFLEWVEFLQKRLSRYLRQDYFHLILFCAILIMGLWLDFSVPFHWVMLTLSVVVWVGLFGLILSRTHFPRPVTGVPTNKKKFKTSSQVGVVPLSHRFSLWWLSRRTNGLAEIMSLLIFFTLMNKSTEYFLFGMMTNAMVVAVYYIYPH